jgi:hypothetical protein
MHIIDKRKGETHGMTLYCHFLLLAQRFTATVHAGETGASG